MGEIKGANKPIEVKPCTCKHEVQDKMYGFGNRVHNPTAKGYKCTVCSKIK